MVPDRSMLSRSCLATSPSGCVHVVVMDVDCIEVEVTFVGAGRTVKQTVSNNYDITSISRHIPYLVHHQQRH